MDKVLVRNALQGMIRATDDDSTPIIRGLARIQARAALENLDAEAASGAGEREPMAAMGAALAAAISLLERGGKKAAPSDKMFEQMLRDYRRALDNGRVALASLPPATDPAMVTVPRAKLEAIKVAGRYAPVGDGYFDPYGSVSEAVDAAVNAALAAAPTIPATGEAVKDGERPYPELLSTAEQRDLLTRAEEMWRDLQANNLGGFSGANRPFWIMSELRRAIEAFGHRDTGLKWSKNDLDAHSKATIPATGHAATEGEG